MCTEAVNQAVAALAAKHGFDAEEALRDLNLGELKLVRKRGPSPKKLTEKSVAKKQKKASAPSAKDEAKPKRAKTGYLMYQAAVRETTKAELVLLLEDGEKLKPQAVVTAIASKWKALSEEERSSWKAQAKAAATDDEADVSGINGPRPSPVETGPIGDDDAELVLGEELVEIDDETEEDE